MKICMAQINTLVGDIAANAQRVIDVCLAQTATGARLIVFPELTLTGYPPEDLLLRGDLLTRTERALQQVVVSCPPELMVVVGYPRARGGQLFNTAGVLREGRVVAEYDKQCLPNYQVFDEKRYFSAGDSPCVVSFEGIQFGLTICEDIWHPEPAALSKAAGAQVWLRWRHVPAITSWLCYTSIRWAARMNWCSMAARLPLMVTARSACKPRASRSLA